MAAKVLDSWALIAFFEDAPAADAVEELIHQAMQEKHRLYLSVVSWAEVYFATMREVSLEAADARAADIATLPIEIVPVGDDLRLARLAAQFKARFNISLANAFSSALAKEKRAELVTGDNDYKALVKEVKIQWI